MFWDNYVSTLKSQPMTYATHTRTTKYFELQIVKCSNFTTQKMGGDCCPPMPHVHVYPIEAKSYLPPALVSECSVPIVSYWHITTSS